MRVAPRSRRGRVALVVAALVAVALRVFLWEELLFGLKLAVPDPAYSAAADRTSAPAPVGPAIDRPTTSPPPASAAGPPTIDVERVIELSDASALADPPGDGDVFVATLAGLVHAVDPVTGTDQVVLDISRLLSTGGERGLLGIAVDPDGERLYLDFTNARGDTEIRSWPLVDGRPVGLSGDGVLHLRIGQPFPNHNAGQITFGPDGALWVLTGDGGGAGDRGEVAQDPGSVLGKILRVVPRETGGVEAPASNDPPDERPEVVGIGLRNPWRWSFDRATNLMWIADVGQNTIEEVSIVDPADVVPNLGWDDLEGLNRYEGERRDGLVDPVITYDHDEGCSVTGGHVYRGDEIASLSGWYLFGDYCGGWVRAVPADDPGRDPVEVLADVGNVVSFAELDSGELWLLTTRGVLRIVAA